MVGGLRTFPDATKLSLTQGTAVQGSTKQPLCTADLMTTLPQWPLLLSPSPWVLSCTSPTTATTASNATCVSDSILQAPNKLQQLDHHRAILQFFYLMGDKKQRLL